MEVAFIGRFGMSVVVGRLCADPTETSLSGHRAPHFTAGHQVVHIGGGG